jgi:aldose 1-epimerase
MEQGGGVRFRLRSPDGDEGYPGNLEASAHFDLRSSSGGAGGSIRVQLLARTDAPTACNLTQHAYFNLAGYGTILDHELEVFASRFVVVDDEFLPTGELASVERTPFDFRTPRRIGERIGALEAPPARGYDLCYVLDGTGFHAPAARLRDPRSGRRLEIQTDQPGLQLYTGNHLDTLPGKGGRVIPRFGGLCLETQRFPDAVHHAHFPSVVLRPGERYASTTVWRLSAG